MFVIGIVVSLIAGVAYPLITGVVDEQALREDLRLTVVAVIAQQVAIVLACILLVRAKGSRPVPALGIRIRPVDFIGIPVGMGLAAVLGIIVAPISNVGDDSKQVIVEQLEKAQGVWLVLFAIVVLFGAPIAEELLYRGLLTRSLQRRGSTLTTVLISGLVFGVSHLIDPKALPALPALVFLGMLLAVTALWTGRLGTPICLHMGFNAVAVISTFLN